MGRWRRISWRARWRIKSRSSFALLLLLLLLLLRTIRMGSLFCRGWVWMALPRRRSWGAAFLGLGGWRWRFLPFFVFYGWSVVISVVVEVLAYTRSGRRTSVLGRYHAIPIRMREARWYRDMLHAHFFLGSVERCGGW